MSKIRKIYNLRKTSNIRQQQSQVQEESRVSQFKEEPEVTVQASDVFDRNVSVLSQNLKDQSKIIEQSQNYLVDGEELTINKLQLNFNVPLNDIEKQEVKIKNIGNSAVYVNFEFKNQPKINPHGFKDSQLKFYCHYQTTVIKPGEQSSFIFSFLSEFPGNFTEEVQIKCKPPLRTKIPNLKLNGTATIKDQWLTSRQSFIKGISEVDLKNEVREILADIVNEVKIPPPPLPDVKDPKIAERQFQIQNAGQNLFYNAYLHGWFTELFNQICQQDGIPTQDRYWNQSVQTLSTMINNSKSLDEVDRKCYQDRLEHYCYLSMTPLPNKSDLYDTVYKFVSQSAFALGGDFVDTARKQLDMWEVPFREPLQTDTPEEEKARKEEIEKIKAEWVKKAKKKKWGEEEQKQMINEFKKKAQALTTEHLLNKFDNFEESAEFVKTRQFIKKSSFKLNDYYRYLQRLKTVRECPLDGKKVMIKWHLKLKQNCEEKLKELDQYLTKKKELEKRLQEEKRDGGKKKKTVMNKNKKKGQKEQEEQKPLFFDFMSILDEENWNGFLETFRVVMEKQPFMVLIGVTYGPRAGRHISQYSVHFLLEHLKALESTIDFFPHENLNSLGQKLQNQSINQGSIFLMENLNFLPWQTCQEQIIEQIAQEGKEQKIQKISKRKLLHPEIREFFDNFGQCIDVLVNQDRYLNQTSGFTSYLNREVVLGTQWWKYVGLSTRIIDSTVIYSQDFTPESYLLVSRLIPTVKNIYLTGLIGLKFYLVQNKIQKLANIVLGASQKQSINDLLSFLEQSKLQHKIIIPKDFSLKRQNQDNTDIMEFDGSQTQTEGFEVIDIGTKTVEEISKIEKGNVFVLGDTSIVKETTKLSTSLSKLIKYFYAKQQIKKERHSQQSSTPAGIDYSEDIVIYLVGLKEQLIEKAELKEKKIKSSEEQDEEGEQEEEEDGDKKKVDLVSDFRLSSLSGLSKLWSGRFDIGLRDISKYPLIHDD